MLHIEPDSFPQEDDVHIITLKILPRRLFDKPAECFEDHSTVMVEILPNNLELMHPAKLSLPHCLILKKANASEVQVFHSHHAKDQQPDWENITKSVLYTLLPHCCEIWIEKFSWIKYTISGREVEGKKLFLYTLGKKCTKASNFITAEVGFFPALPGNDRITHDEADFITSSKRTVSVLRGSCRFQIVLNADISSPSLLGS
ncbi:hypothetical protein HOLleu_25569 [Holothuria leucospilota]|uniref:Uncharacterized protein n=1 Tax=Holothuria leucospilota TaxID=206669 RepID=A0A9Q1BS44_HOLLE|nr:hypothetical protein HOLleu_25569 [Holothuria leucospilota]